MQKTIAVNQNMFSGGGCGCGRGGRGEVDMCRGIENRDSHFSLISFLKFLARINPIYNLPLAGLKHRFLAA